jgi:putative phage-type endonuclease
MIEETLPISIKNKLVFYTNDMLPTFTPSRLEFNRAQVERLKLIPQPEQRSPEWYTMRHSMLSASDWGSILGMSKYGGGKNQVLLKKCCDDVPFFTNAAMKWGIKYEAVAIQIYEYRNKTQVIEFGCIRHPTIHHLGASPDGITPEGVMLEIKCPSSRVIDGIIPDGYYCQVQGQLEVCELDRCDFLECKLVEYQNEQDYLTDCDKNGNFFYNTYGNEKGVVANLYDMKNNKEFFEYSPIGIIGQELKDWKNEMLSKYRHQSQYVLSEFSYWFLHHASCIPIYRNQEWFYKASKELKEFWEQVCYYRSVGPDKLKEDLQKIKTDKLVEKEQIKEEKEKEKEKNKKPQIKSKKISDFMICSSESDDSDPEQVDYGKNMNVFSVFSDDSESKQIHNPFKPYEEKNNVEQKKNDLKKMKISKTVKKDPAKINILNIFTDEEVRDMKK